MNLENAYQRALDSALIVRHPSPGLVRMLGRDRLDLLNRMSTNEVEKMEAGEIRPTVLTNAIGRMIDSIEVLARPDEAWLLTHPDRAAIVRDWLRGYIFFQDDVQLELAETPWALWGVYGPEARETTQGVFPEVGEAGSERAVEIGRGLAWSVERPVAGFRLLLDPADDRASTAWNSAGEIESLAYDVLRIEAGVSEFGREFDEESIPLEAGLWHAVSFEKGCYIGQEIIARMESRGRQAKQLAGLQLNASASPGDAISQDGKKVGQVTSVARSPRLGWIALGIARPQALETDGGAVAVGDARAPGRLVSLPFQFDPSKERAEASSTS